jgi:ubiquinone/menaquinone biosynthesis C-methylase UbiE
LLSKDPKFERTESIAAAYDSIYAAQSRVWENQGRTPEFIRYFSSLLDRFAGARSLEIGCGEGFLLAARSDAGDKYGVDLSMEAIRKARGRAPAHYSMALAERLPFPAHYFDLVTSVGVMEHFLDTEEALGEIRRVLKSGGHYINLVHVALTFGEQLRVKTSEFIFPRPRPIRLARWIKGKLTNGQHFVHQPIQNRYTTEGGKAWLEKTGFVVSDVLHRRRYPDLPLIGPSVVIYVAEK